MIYWGTMKTFRVFSHLFTFHPFTFHFHLHLRFSPFTFHLHTCSLVCNVISSFVVMRGGLLSDRPASSKLAELVVLWNVVKVLAVSPSALDATKQT